MSGRDLYLCPHCGRALGLAIARRHAELHYDPAAARWTVLHMHGHARAPHTDPRVTLGWSPLMRAWGAAPEDSVARVTPTQAPSSQRGIKRPRVDAVPLVPPRPERQIGTTASAAGWHATAAAHAARPLPTWQNHESMELADDDSDTTGIETVSSGEGEAAAAAAEVAVTGPGPAPAPAPAPAPVPAAPSAAVDDNGAADGVGNGAMPTDDGFTDAERAAHRDPSANSDGLVIAHFTKPPTAAKLLKWYRLVIFLRTWGRIFRITQRAMKFLNDILMVLCADVFARDRGAPLSQFKAEAMLGLQLRGTGKSHKPLFKQFVVCERCHALYNWCEACSYVWPYIGSHGSGAGAAAAACRQCAYGVAAPSAGDSRSPPPATLTSCTFVAYPRSRYKRSLLGGPCGHALLRDPALRDEGNDDITEFQGDAAGEAKAKRYRRQPPRRVFVYQPLAPRLAQLLARPDFEVLCERWRSRMRASPPGVMFDMQHGRMWRRFLTVQDPATGRRLPFLCRQYGIALTLNVDWMQPWKHVQYSVGVLYFTIANLPLEHRFSRENVLLLGVLPGGSEAKVNLNAYLAPVVDDLLNFHPCGPGVRISTHQHPKGVPVRAALICICCDMPASRKVSGYSVHGADMGCNRCERNWSNVVRLDDPAAGAADDRPPRRRLPGDDVDSDDDLANGDVEPVIPDEAEVEEKLIESGELLIDDAKRAPRRGEGKGIARDRSSLTSLPSSSAAAVAADADADVDAGGDAGAAGPCAFQRRTYERTWKLGRPRRNSRDRRSAEAWQDASGPTARNKVQKVSGVKWTVLNRLSYFRGAEMTVPDPMHTVWMGLVKTTMRRHRDLNWPIASAEGKRQLAAMQRVLDRMEMPSGICRILSKFESNMSHLNAAQLKSFVTSLSPAVYAGGRLSRGQLVQWRHLVEVAGVLTAAYMKVRPRLAAARAPRSAGAAGDMGLGGGGDGKGEGNSDEDDDAEHQDADDSENDDEETKRRKADRGLPIDASPADDIIKVAYHLRAFAKSWELGDGDLPRQPGYPLLHLAQHLKRALTDFGPAVGWNCFSFERYNGILGKTKTNGHDIETTFMKVWCQLDTLFALPHLTGEWARWSEHERKLFNDLHGVATPSAALRVPSAVQLACDRSRTPRVYVHTTAVACELARWRQQRRDAIAGHAAPHLSMTPPALVLTGAEQFVGELVASKTRRNIALDVSSRRTGVADAAIHGGLMRYFTALYGPPSAPEDPAATAAAALALRAPPRAPPGRPPFASWSLSLQCARSNQLRWFADTIGTRVSRQRTSSWVMMLSGSRVCPAQCILFANPVLQIIHLDGTVEHRAHVLVRVRWFRRQRDEDHSTGVRVGDDMMHLWMQHGRGPALRPSGREAALPAEWAPVQAIVRRFVYAPTGDTFRTCPLPISMRL